jgi:hypothetical protein
MAGSNDRDTRKRIFAWIKAHEDTFYKPRTAIAPIGVYFSPQTRNYYADEFITSYRGILILLMQKHLEFQVVTPRTLSEFQGHTLILPDVRVANEDERALLRKYAAGGNTLVITGEDATQFASAANVLHFSKCPGKDYYAALQNSFEETNPDRENEFLESLKSETPVRVAASPLVATSISRVNGKTSVFFANFAGLRGGANPIQTPQADVQVTVSGARGGHGFFLPFLGDVQPLSGTASDGGISYKLPAIEKGAVFWYEP